jgi:hypothetical protein
MKNIYLIKTDKPSRLYLQSNNELQLRTNIIRTSEDYLGTNQHIYITNSEKPKARDWVLGDFPDNPIGKVISKYGQEFTVQSLNGDKYGLAEYDSKKIILTTDPDLIKEGIQSINDEFLQWFVKNPSCEMVEVVFSNRGITGIEKILKTFGEYKIILPQEEPKQETLEEAAEQFANDCTLVSEAAAYEAFIAGAKFQAQRMYTDVLEEPKQLTVEEVAEKYCLINNIPIDQMIVKNDRSCEFETPITMFIKGAKFQAERMYSEEEVHQIIESYQNIMENNPVHTSYNKWFSQFKKQNNEQ